MTHDPQLVDTVARAIRRELNGPSDVELPPALESSAVDRYRRMARAALAAMPQPIGYTFTCPDNGEVRDDIWPTAADVHEHTPEAIGTDPVVVALVPVDRP